MRTVVQFRELLDRVGSSRFVRLHPHPVLVHVRGEIHDNPAEFATERLDVTKLLSDSSAGTQSQHVFEVLKRGENYPALIGVGRTRNCDVQIVAPDVSKYHAAFLKPRDGGDFKITDARSKNGTFVNGTRLAVKEKAVASSGASIAFGQLEFLFLEPHSFVDHLGAQ